MKKITRFNFFPKPTPIEFLENLSGCLNGPKIFLKRDDLTGIALGGNKVRKLEYLLADAVSKSCDLIITTGGPQSNHARITAGICASMGLTCVLVLCGKKPKVLEGNMLLDKIFGAKIVYAGTDDFSEIDKLIEKISKEGRKKGFTPYVIPMGGTNGLGEVGNVECFIEIITQLKRMKEKIDYIVLTNGSSGTHAGLEVGKVITGSKIEIAGINVQFDKAETVDRIYKGIEETFSVLGMENKHNTGLRVYGDYIKPGYGKTNKLTLEAISLMGKKEGIVLDTIYTGKAFGGFIDLIRKKVFTKKDNVLFMHTGGYPGIVAMPAKDKRFFK